MVFTEFMRAVDLIARQEEILIKETGYPLQLPADPLDQDTNCQLRLVEFRSIGHS
jgi:hypothetical protein